MRQKKKGISIDYLIMAISWRPTVMKGYAYASIATSRLGGNMTVEIRLNEDGSLDEIVGKNEFAHLEQMDGDHWYLRIGNISVHLTSTKTIEAIFDESPMLLSPQVD